MSKDDRDRIRQILEGHQKKVSIKTILITAIVVIIAGIVVGYFILSMKENTNTVSYNMKKLEHIVKNKEHETNINAPNNNNPQTANHSLDNNTISKQIEKKNGSKINENESFDLNNNNEKPKTYEVKNEIQEENSKNTQTDNGVGSIGPKIINPYAKHENNNTETISVKQGKKAEKHPQKTIKSTKSTIEEKAKKEIEMAKKSQKKKEMSTKPKIVNKKENASKVKHAAPTKQVVSNKDKHVKNKYVVQISSYQNKKQAQEMLNNLKKAGYTAFLTTALINNTTYTRVMIGPFDGYFDAKKVALSAKEKMKLKYMPMIKKYAKLP